jgi:RNA polymerase sigma-70 factor (ECF subfamily)
MIDSQRAYAYMVRPVEESHPSEGDDPQPRSGVTAEVSRARLRAMYEDNFALIWRMLHRLGVPPPMVDDAASQVFLVATHKVESIRVGFERSFLLGVTVRVAADARRSRSTARELIDADLDAREHPSPGAAELLDDKRALEVLDAVLEAMPFPLRTVFILFEIEGISTHDIAPLLGLPRGTVVSRLRRARQQFQAIAKRYRAKQGWRGGDR